MEFEKHLIQNAVEGASFAEKYGCQPPSSFPCVAVVVEVDPDPRPCYWEVEYVYRTEFETGAKAFDSEVHQKMLDDDHSFPFGYKDMPDKGERSRTRPWDGEDLF